MTRPISGTLAVTDFININVGEYSFENATFANITDLTGNGAYDISIGYLIYVQATDVNIATPIPGLFHRYKFTSVNASDASTFSGTIIWDELGAEEDAPTNGSLCLIAEPTTNKKLGIVPNDSNYPDLPPGSSLAALLIDARYIIDNLQATANFDNLVTDLATLSTDVTQLKTDVTDIRVQVQQLSDEFDVLRPQIYEALKTTFYTHYQNTSSDTWIIEHNKGSTTFVCSLFSPTGSMVIPDSVTIIDANTVVVAMANACIGTATLFIHK